MSSLRLLLPLLLVLPVVTPRLEAGTLPVTGEAVVLVKPDQVVVTLGIEVREAQLAVAKEKFEVIAKQVGTAITGLGIAPEQVRTDCLEIAPYYHERSTQERLIPEYYRINRVMAVTLRDTKLVDALVSAALASGATHVLDVDFRTTELRKHRDEARRLAIRAAKEKAALLVGEIGRELGKADSISEGNYGWYAYNPYRSRMDNRSYQSQNMSVNDGGSANGDTVVPPGQIAVSANVQMTFEFN
jgi:uncharacterized protein YggE